VQVIGDLAESLSLALLSVDAEMLCMEKAQMAELSSRYTFLRRALAEAALAAEVAYDLAKADLEESS